MKSVLAIFLLLGNLCFVVNAGEARHDSPGMGNPLVPGYYADPTVRKFGDTFYMYATTDGTAAGNGPSQVWISKDFVNWTNLSMNWPKSQHIWAPDVVQDDNGLYYFYYSQPCQIYAGCSESPIGPWTSMNPSGNVNNDGMIIPNKYVDPVITLDWQMFKDDDGKRYGKFCTWAIYNGHGCGMVEVGPDMLPIDSTKGMIPNTQLPEVFEAPFMVKKDGTYYLMYSSGSCHTDTYCVQYATAKNIWGPYSFDKVNNPILSTNSDGSIHGPGHHCILEQDGSYYIIYHRHDNPHSNHGMHRQIAADRIEFGPNNTLKKVKPTHTGIGYLGENTNPFDNLLFQKAIKASSCYSEEFKPQFAVDDNNGTLWKAKTNILPQTLDIDLGLVKRIQRTWTQFQYPNWYYQYLIEYSTDGKSWQIFSDKRNNTLEGCPMVDYGDVQARYLRLTVTGLEKPGMSAAIWNFKAFEGAKYDPPQLLVHLEANDCDEGPVKECSNHRGMIGGSFIANAQTVVDSIDHNNVIVMPYGSSLKLSKPVPDTIINNKVFSIVIKSTDQDGKNQQIALVADGQSLKTYINAELIETEMITKPLDSLFTYTANNKDNNTNLRSLRIYARDLHQSEIKYLMDLPYQKPAAPSVQPMGLLVDLDAADLSMGAVDRWSNKGLLKEKFTPQGTSPVVELVSGVKAVTFKGRDYLQSAFKIPASLFGNGSYTVAVWAYNPEVADIESMVSWGTYGGLEATSASLGYGRNRDLGAVAHNGWADLRYNKVPAPGKWHHIAVTFDGHMENVYVDGVLDNHEQKMLHITPTDEIFIGRAHNQSNFFSGSIASLKIYDQALSPDQVRDMAAQKPSSDVIIKLDTASLVYGPIDTLANTGSLEGQFNSKSSPPVITDVDGRIALSFDGSQELISDTPINKASRFTIVAYVKSDSQNQAAFINRVHNNRYSPLPARLDNKWCHVIISNNGRAYINGKMVPTTRIAIPDLMVGEKISIGKDFKGAIADLTVFNKTLSESEVSGLYLAHAADLDAPNPAAFDTSPTAITLNSVSMTAKKAKDLSGRVQYYFQELTGNSGGNSSGWISDNFYENYGLLADTEYAYSVKVRDHHGNVSQASRPAKIRINSNDFEIYSDEFDKDHDFLANGTGGTIWDGLIADTSDKMKVLEAKNTNGKFRLKATGAIADEANGAPFLYKNIDGDFVIEAKIAPFEGWNTRRPPGLLEPAMMVRVANDSDAGPGEDHLRSGIFPYWECGNLWTTKNGSRRRQGFNRTAYNSDMYLQIQRSGNTFYFRTSPDGKNWKPLPETPLLRADMDSLPLQVGLTQSIHQDNETGWVEFDWFKLIVKKK